MIIHAIFKQTEMFYQWELIIHSSKKKFWYENLNFWKLHFFLHDTNIEVDENIPYESQAVWMPEKLQEKLEGIVASRLQLCFYKWWAAISNLLLLDCDLLLILINICHDSLNSQFMIMLPQETWTLR